MPLSNLSWSWDSFPMPGTRQSPRNRKQADSNAGVLFLTNSSWQSSHKQAIEKAEKEFAIYRKREMDLLESDFDKEIKRLKDKNDNNPN